MKTGFFCYTGRNETARLGTTAKTFKNKKITRRKLDHVAKVSVLCVEKITDEERKLTF
jgi:hypothetical protein